MLVLSVIAGHISIMGKSKGTAKERSKKEEKNKAEMKSEAEGDLSADSFMPMLSDQDIISTSGDSSPLSDIRSYKPPRPDMSGSDTKDLASGSDIPKSLPSFLVRSPSTYTDMHTEEAKKIEKEHYEFVLHAYQAACASGLTEAQARRAAQEASIESSGGVLNKDKEQRPVTSTSKYRAT